MAFCFVCINLNLSLINNTFSWRGPSSLQNNLTQEKDKMDKSSPKGQVFDLESASHSTLIFHTERALVENHNHKQIFCNSFQMLSKAHCTNDDIELSMIAQWPKLPLTLSR